MSSATRIGTHEADNSRFETNVVDDEVQVFRGELDAGQRDFFERTEEAREEHLRDVLPQIAATRTDQVDARLGKIKRRLAELLARVRDGEERLVVRGVFEELLRLRNRLVGVLFRPIDVERVPCQCTDSRRAASEEEGECTYSAFASTIDLASL